jgi:hypothetical protein
VFLRLSVVLGELCILATSASSASSASAAFSAANLTPPANEGAFASRVCDALVSWEGSVDDQTTAFKSQIQRLDEPEEIKGAILSFLSSASGRTQQLTDEVASIDPSALSSGQDAQAGIVGALQANVMGFQAALGKIQQLDTYDKSAMITALLRVITEVRSSKLNAQLRLHSFADAGLDHAFRTTSSCKTFYG